MTELVSIKRQCRGLLAVRYLNDNKEANGFESLWGRFIFKETGLKARLTKGTSGRRLPPTRDSLLARSGNSRRADAGFTKRVYVRKPELMRPAKGRNEYATRTSIAQVRIYPACNY
jgi:hypothetical protein